MGHALVHFVKKIFQGINFFPRFFYVNEKRNATNQPPFVPIHNLPSSAKLTGGKISSYLKVNQVPEASSTKLLEKESSEVVLPILLMKNNPISIRCLTHISRDLAQCLNGS